MKKREGVINCGKAVMFLIICGDEVLLEKRPDNEKGFANEIIIPGGKNEPGEDHLTAVIREVKEETGLEDAKLVLLGNDFQVITTSVHKYSTRSYLIVVDRKDKVVNITLEKGKHIWLGLQRAKQELKWSHFLLALEWADKYLREE